MRPRHANRICVPACRVAFALAATVLFMMPMTYRGGAETAHAHALLQLWADAAHSMPDHHHAYLRQSPSMDSGLASDSHISPDIPRSQQSAFVVGVAPIPMLAPAIATFIGTRRRCACPEADDPRCAGVRLRPESPPPKPIA